jgi:hypothetical protein
MSSSRTSGSRGMRVRAGGVRLAVVTMVLAVLQVGAMVSAGAPAATAATVATAPSAPTPAVPPVDCSSRSIYTLNWGLTLDASGVSQLPTGQVGSTTLRSSAWSECPTPPPDEGSACGQALMMESRGQISSHG